MKKVNLVKCIQGGSEVYIDGINFGVFDQIDLGGSFVFFPRRTHLLNGRHYIAIGEALNKLNEGL